VIVGFTGTRNGMSVYQKEAIRRLIRIFRGEGYAHGDCVGGDKEFDDLVLEAIDETNLCTTIHVFPPTNPVFRAWCGHETTYSSYLVYHENDYLVRDRLIVNLSDIMIAAPAGEEIVRSGTWYTVRYAIRTNKHVFIIYPDYMDLAGG
jgi:hypothetical protein